MSNGVRKGGILSPYLFSLYMDDLSDELNAVQARCFVGSRSINHLMYTDDLCCFAPNFDGLQDLVNVCSKYLELPCIVFDASKSTGMIFHAPFWKYFLPKLYIAGNPISFSNFVKYLGIHLNQSLTDNNDIMKQVKFLYTAENKLRSDFSKCTVSDKIRCFALTVHVFMLLNYGGILTRKTLKQGSPTLCPRAPCSLREQYEALARTI